MDPLSDLLHSVRLNGAFFYLSEGVHPWSAVVLPARELRPRVLPASEHLICYHIVLSGSCWGSTEGEQQLRLETGDAIVFPHGDAHFVSSAEGQRTRDDVYRSAPNRPLDVVRMGPTAGPRTTLICGYLGCDARPFNPLLASLPRTLHARGITKGWLSAFPTQVMAESRHPCAGGSSMLTRMAELMFVEVIRQYVATLPPTQTGWLAGLRDSVVAAALALLHGDPGRAWTLPELAREAVTSRTVLIERFTTLIGMPPMQYLTQWRLQRASERLVTGSDKIAAIAAEVGYESEAAFSRAFKRITGCSPAAWRRSRRHDAA